MEVKELICIGCPLGCPLTIAVDGENITVSGHTCARGEAYGKKEISNPTRIVTSSIHVKGGELEMVSVKTLKDVPKDKIFAIMHEIHAVRVDAPVAIGDVIISNCAGTNVEIVATKNVAAV